MTLKVLRKRKGVLTLKVHKPTFPHYCATCGIVISRSHTPLANRNILGIYRCPSCNCLFGSCTLKEFDTLLGNNGKTGLPENLRKFSITVEGEKKEGYYDFTNWNIVE